MFRLLVRDAGGGIAINLDEHEARRVVGLLHHIEPRDAGFLHAGAGVGERGGLERFETFRFYPDVDMHDEHAGEIGQIPPKLKRRLRF